MSHGIQGRRIGGRHQTEGKTKDDSGKRKRKTAAGKSPEQKGSQKDGKEYDIEICPFSNALYRIYKGIVNSLHRPHIPGTVVGIVIIGLIYNGMNLLGVESYWQTVCKGVLIVLAVLLDKAMNKRR